MPIQNSVMLLKEYDIDSLPESDRRSFVLPFTSLQCTSSKLVGGKGCQLALLTQLNSKVGFICNKLVLITFVCTKYFLSKVICDCSWD